MAPQCVVAAAVEGDNIAGVAALPVANESGHWQAPLAALRALLAAQETEPRRAVCAGSRHDGAVMAALAAQSPLSVSLSSRWCHAIMAPWSDALLAEPAATRFLQMQLSAVYGDGARSWSIASDDAPYGQPRAVCGMDGELLHALRTDLGKRCTAVEPVMGTASRMQTGMSAFAIVEAGKLTMATMARGRIAAICTQPCGAAWHTELARAWQRWALRMPELDAITAVAVIDLSGRAALHPAGQLPPLFHVADTPFGPPSALVPAGMREAICA